MKIMIRKSVLSRLVILIPVTAAMQTGYAQQFSRSVITFEYTTVKAFRGDIPAASQVQLCRIGSGSNRQWDEAAIGSRGESIRYDPGLVHARAP